MKKLIAFLLACCMMLPDSFSFSQIQAAKTTEDQKEYIGNDEYFTLVYEDGSVDYIYYDQDEPKDTPANDSDTSGEVNPAGYNVAYLKGLTTYTEYDGSGTTGRTGYCHGQSAYDAAYICTNSNGTIRIKQSGVYMDVAASAVTISSYSSSSYVGYYLCSSDGYIRHYYYYLNNGTPSLYGIPVGYAPDYLSKNVKYYSYDGHYFYTDYESMIHDYRTSVNTFTHAINPVTPYYNYYQYLSMRAPTIYSGADLDRYIQHAVDIYSSVTTSSALYGQGQYIKNNESSYAVNSVLLLGIAINESGWGNSNIAKTKNNLFGLNAADGNTSGAYAFDSVESCINYFSYNKVSCVYCNAASSLYRGGFLGDKKSGINVVYASDAYWGEKAAYYGYIIDNYLKEGDYNRFSIGIDSSGELPFYADIDCTKCLYNITINYQNNIYLYGYATTILGQEGNAYKVLSDTVLNDSRTGQNTQGTYSYDRDYLYVKQDDVTLIGEAAHPSVGDTTGGNTDDNTEENTGGDTSEQPTDEKEDQTVTLPFEDVAETSWYYEYVKAAYIDGIMTGTSDTTFSPYLNMNRAMVVVTLYRMSNSPETAYQSLYLDVPSDKYYSKAVTWASENNIVTGYTSGENSGKFGPSDLIQRQQVAMMLYRYAQYIGMENTENVDLTILDQYPDAMEVSSYAKVAMAWAISNGILTGSQGNLLPKANATRAECAKMLMVAKKLYDDSQYTTDYDPIGYLDNLYNSASGRVYASGWAYDEDDLSQSLSIHVYADNAYIGTLTADFERKDVNEVRGVTGYHGFSGSVGTDLRGSHKIDIYAVDLGTGEEFYLGSKTITIA